MQLVSLFLELRTRRFEFCAQLVAARNVEQDVVHGLVAGVLRLPWMFTSVLDTK